MAAELSLWGPVTADTTAETVFTNVTGTIAVLESITIAQGSTAAATVVRISYGADGATTREIEFSVPAGTGTYFLYPAIRITGTNTLQLSSTTTDDVAVTSGNGYRVAA